ncbi:MAG: MarR family winged helix-turn-helix transcriptional regulator, partial [Actinomycetota bacterium]
MPELTDADYRRLLDFRDGLRRFLRWSEARADEAGVTPAQHQLLLAVRGHGGPAPPSISDLSEHLLLRHHSIVELVDRAVASGLVRRQHDPADHRVVHVALTGEGAAKLELLASAHLEEIARFVVQFQPLVDDGTLPAFGGGAR